MAHPYPLHGDIETSAALFKRTGSKSILSIGSGGVTDFAKAIRIRVHGGLVHAIAASQNKGLAIPLLSVATTVSHTHSVSGCGILNPEDDILQHDWSLPPEVILYIYSLQS